LEIPLFSFSKIILFSKLITLGTHGSNGSETVNEAIPRTKEATEDKNPSPVLL